MNNCINSVLSDCITALVCPRGEFYPNKNYGSQIKVAKDKADDEKLLNFARQALSNMDGVYVKGACMNEKNAEFILMINNEERQVTIAL